ncbi:MAG: hypothetical protein HY006_04420 [Candidatus Sungbacteria bacterium]|nr:hypothetical protein [Candidatus Sungbacteria bacterium]
MKKINPSRWRKPSPEEIDFEAEPIANRPLGVEQGSGAQKTTDKTRTSVRMPLPQYHVVIPQKRVRIRHAFEIYEDQLDAFKKLQAAHRDIHGNNRAPSLSDMARESFDTLIKERIKSAKNIDISYDQRPEN